MVRLVVPPSQAPVPPGTYRGVLVEVREQERDGKKFLTWSFEVRTREGGRTVRGYTSDRLGPRSKAYKWLTALLGREPREGEIVDTDDFLGQRCLILVAEREDGRAVVENVLPLDDTL